MNWTEEGEEEEEERCEIVWLTSKAKLLVIIFLISGLEGFPYATHHEAHMKG